MYVESQNVKSEIKIVTAGVPQGSVLGPTLFNLYINDIPKHKDVDIGLFADDTAIFASSYRTDTITNRLEAHTKRILHFFEKWKISANKAKTEAILFTKRRPILPRNIKVGNTSVSWSESVKYLGVTLDRKLTFTKHITNLSHKGNAALVSLYPLINRNSCLSTSNKLLIYKAIVRPAITYACPVWSFTCKTNTTNYR